MWPFKRTKESPEEIAAEKKLDEVTWDLANAHMASDPRSIYYRSTADDEGPYPIDHRGLKEAFRAGAEERREELDASSPEPPPE
jgi:hypothetical protein